MYYLINKKNINLLNLHIIVLHHYIYLVENISSDKIR